MIHFAFSILQKPKNRKIIPLHTSDQADSLKSTVYQVVFGLLIVFLYQNCSFPYADKQFLNFDPSSKGERVKHEIMGPVMIFKIKTGETPSLLSTINALSKINSCTELKNIDIEFFENYYYIVGFPKIVILADCIKTQEEKKQ